jgi:hypothetical protein
MEAVDSYLLAAGLGLAAIACVLLVTGFVRALAFGNAYRRELLARARKSRIRRMLGALGVRLGGYSRRAGSVAVERHLYKCERCPDLQACDDYLDRHSGEDPARFCPNHGELKVFASSSARAHSDRPG